MAKHKLSEELKFGLTFNQYSQLIKSFFLRSNIYLNSFSTKPSLREYFIFYLINSCVGLLLKILVNFILTLNISLIFLGVNQIIFLLFVFTLFLFIFNLVLFGLSKLFKGSADLSSILKAFCYLSPAFILIWLPFIWVVSLLYFIYLLIRLFNIINSYSLISAIINILLPIFLISLILSGGAFL